MFEEARQKDAVLILDEADSFLADRRGADHSWEVTQVNELLTQMEAFDGVFVCTTNLMEPLDPASLRRFDFKVEFDWLTAAQRWRMFAQELVRMGFSALVDTKVWSARLCCLDRLTTGDFAVAARQFDLYGETPTPEELFRVLADECAAKGNGTRRVGFVS